MARTRKRRMMNQINVVPYIDVTLVLTEIAICKFLFLVERQDSELG